jgi:hypothetical protein
MPFGAFMTESGSKTKRPPKQVVPRRPTETPDLPPGARYNLPPIQPERVTTQTAKDLAKKPANQAQE